MTELSGSSRSRPWRAARVARSAGRDPARLPIVVLAGVLATALMWLLVGAVSARLTGPPPFSATVTGVGTDGRQITVILDVAPTRAGLQTVHLYTYTDTGAVLPFRTATGTLVERRQNLGPIRFGFVPTGAGHGTAPSVAVPGPGSWTLTAQVHTASGTEYAATVTYTVH